MKVPGECGVCRRDRKNEDREKTEARKQYQREYRRQRRKQRVEYTGGEK